MEVKEREKVVIPLRKWTKKEDLLLVKLFDKGYSNQEIAIILNRSTASINARTHKFSLKRPKQKYVLYINDKYVAEGTKEEIAERTYYDIDTLTTYIYRTKYEPEKHNIHVYPIED